MMKHVTKAKSLASATVVLAAMISTTAALAAASVTNRDDKDYKLTIIEGDKKRDITLKPNEELKDICPSGCVLRLNDSDDDEYQIDPQDVVSIEDGSLYYDTPDTEPETKSEEPKKK